MLITLRNKTCTWSCSNITNTQLGECGGDCKEDGDDTLNSLLSASASTAGESSIGIVVNCLEKLLVSRACRIDGTIGALTFFFATSVQSKF